MNKCTGALCVHSTTCVWALPTGGCPFAPTCGLSWWSLSKPFSLTWFLSHLWPLLLCWLGDPSFHHGGVHNSLLMGAVPARSHLSLVFLSTDLSLVEVFLLQHTPETTLWIEYDPERSSSLCLFHRPVVLATEVIKLLCRSLDLGEGFLERKIHMGMF